MQLLLINCILLLFIFLQCNVIKEGNEDEEIIRQMDIKDRINQNKNKLNKIKQDLDDLFRHKKK